MMERTRPLDEAIAAYLAELRRGLRALPASEQEDVVREIASHVEDALAAGQPIEAVLASLGAPREVASALVSERLVAVDRKRSTMSLVGMVMRAAALPFVAGFLAFLAVTELNTWYMYAILRAHPGAAVMAKQLWLNLPAIVVFILPAAALMVAPLTFPRLAREMSAETLRRIMPALAGALVLLGLVGSTAAVVWGDLVVTPANRQCVDLVRTGFWHEKGVEAEALRSPQELTIAQLHARIADAKRERDQRVQAGAPFSAVEGRDRAIRKLEVAYDLKFSLPAMTFGNALMGLAIGLVLTRRRPFPSWVAIGLVVAVVFGDYFTLMGALNAVPNWGLPPVVGAWLPLALQVVVSAAIWAWSRIARIGYYADV